MLCPLKSKFTPMPTTPATALFTAFGKPLHDTVNAQTKYAAQLCIKTSIQLYSDKELNVLGI
jgi:hypothetical protein